MLGTTVDIGYALAPSHCGKGFMAQAIRTLTAVTLQNSGIFRIHAACDA